MAEQKKSIEISYKANLNDLLAKLKTIPNVTDQEAKKMVAALDRQLKQAEKAAKKSADASKKAAKDAAQAAARGAHQFDELGDSARRAEERLERVGDASGDIDRGFSSIGLALRGVNPQLAEAADGIADAFAVTEGLTMSFAALNPVVVALAATVGTLTLGYMAYQQEIEKAKQLTLDLREAQKSLSDSYKELQANFTDSLNKLGEIQDEYAVLTGQITEYELALKQTERNTKAMFQTNIDQQQSVIDGRKEELQLINSMMQSNLGSIKDARLLSDAEKERLNNLQLLTKGVNKTIDLTKHDLALNVELAKIRDSLNNEIAKQEKGLEIIVGHQKQAVDMAMQIQEHENETKRVKEEQKDIDKESTKLQKKRKDNAKEELDDVRNLIALMNERFNKQQSALKDLDKLSEETGLNDEQRDFLNFQREMDRIRELGKVSGDTALAEDIIKEATHQRQLDRLEELKEKRKEGAKQSLEQAIELGKVLGDFAEQRIENNQIDVEQQLEKQKELMEMSKIERQAFEQDKKQQLSLFRFRKGMAIADIAMSTAEAVAAAQKLIAPFNAIKTALALATGAAQTAIVMGQKPPSFHMGGMAPDEMGARVLQGEAVLDRATVQRIGGEEGVQQLQEGNIGDSKVVVIQPFKHFGRFAKEIGFRAPIQTGLRAY
tara:strand:+ start:2472 stop:4463 length:1992 start_codon:yes stop_codon:yes gene_type:complete